MDEFLKRRDQIFDRELPAFSCGKSFDYHENFKHIDHHECNQQLLNFRKTTYSDFVALLMDYLNKVLLPLLNQNLDFCTCLDENGFKCRDQEIKRACYTFESGHGCNCLETRGFDCKFVRSPCNLYVVKRRFYYVNLNDACYNMFSLFTFDCRMVKRNYDPYNDRSKIITCETKNSLFAEIVRSVFEDYFKEEPYDFVDFENLTQPSDQILFLFYEFG